MAIGCVRLTRCQRTHLLSKVLENSIFSNTFARMVLVAQFMMSYADIYVSITLIVLTSCVIAISRARVRFARARAGLFYARAWSRVLPVYLQRDEVIIGPYRLTLACLMNYCVWLLWGGSRIVSANAPLFNLILFVMIRVYELSKASKRHSALLCEVQRFPHDVVGKMRYYFADGSMWFKFPSSWIAPQIADEIRRFVELVSSPHWLAEIKPNCRYLDDSRNHDTDVISF